MRNLALVLIGALVVVGCNGAGSMSAVSGKPEDTVKAFVDAVNNGDGKAALDCVLVENPDANGASGLLKESPMKLDAKDFKVEMKDPYLASVSYTFSGSITHAPPMSAQSDHVLVLFTQGKWKILGGGFPMGDMAPGLGAIASMFEMSGVFEKAHQAAQRTAAISDAKQIALGVIMYSQDFDDTTPLMANTKDAIMPYVKNKDLFTAPGDPPGTDSFSFNEKVMGIPESKIASPANTVLLYQGSNHQLHFDKDGKAAVAFCDGHAKLISQDQAATLNWDPTK